MSATTPPRKRAAAKKASPRQKQVENLRAFEEYRRRAHAANMSLKLDGNDAEPYLLGPEQGFDPPIALVPPKGLVESEQFDRAMRSNDVFGALRQLLGSEYMRVLQAFDTQDDAPDLLIGLLLAATDHFKGQGATAVPGGTRAS